MFHAIFSFAYLYPAISSAADSFSGPYTNRYCTRDIVSGKDVTIEAVILTRRGRRRRRRVNTSLLHLYTIDPDGQHTVEMRCQKS
jgi:hypothetical protein